ncbi:hypothetical protein N8I74_15785 [Chitiniphilus purpureus]|uniref:Uncharacterized protein n=1 Tax=Chitiniphilus purpureus TaxID=2981137 RepID=A0ABY6DK85_9NEIS|nr:hypothetical protein [Chitiniphilus sp. CD1]UXY14764.1 hypothetical protein N8I74_15785 [Chitiniphilus sp. CD1]
MEDKKANTDGTSEIAGLVAQLAEQLADLDPKQAELVMRCGEVLCDREPPIADAA